MSRRSSSSSISTLSSLRDDDQMMRDCYELKKRLLQTQHALNQLGNTSFGSRSTSKRSSPCKPEALQKETREKDIPILTLEDLSPKASSIYSVSDYQTIDASLPLSGGRHRQEETNYMEGYQVSDGHKNLRPNLNKRKLVADPMSTSGSLLLAENDKLKLELESASFELQEIKAQLTNSQLCLEQSLRSSGHKKKRIKDLEEKLQDALENLRTQTAADTTLRLENDKLRGALAKQEEVLRELEGLCTNLQSAQSTLMQKQRTQKENVEDSLDRSPTNQSAVFTIAELRLQLAKQEAENQRLQGALKTQQGLTLNKHNTGGAGDVPAVSDIRTELSAVIERNRLGDRKQQELERIITYLEDEVARHTSRVLELEERLQDSNEARAKLEDRVSDKGTKMTHLQRELETRLAEINDLRFKVSQDEAELKRQQEAMVKKDADLRQSAEAIQKLETTLQEKQRLVVEAGEAFGLKENEARQSAVVIQKIKILHAEHCKELDQQIELLQQRLNNKTTQLAKMEGAIAALRQENQQREAECGQLQLSLDEAQKRIKELDAHEKKLKVIEEQASQGSKQVVDLESALTKCQLELNTLTERTEENRRGYETSMLEGQREITRKVEEIRALEATMSTLQKTVHELRHSLEQRDDMLLSSQERINNLEDSHTHAQNELSSLTQSSAKDRSLREEELGEVKRRCQETEEALTLKISQIAALNGALKEVHAELKQENLKRMEAEEKLNGLMSEHQGAKEELTRAFQEVKEVMSRERQVKEENTNLQSQFKEMVEKLEKAQARNSDMESKVDSAQQELQQTLVQLSELQSVLQLSQSSAKEKERQMTELDRRLNVSEEELLLKEGVLRNHEKQLLAMDMSLKDKQQQLKDKTLQVVHLDLTLKEQRSELQERLNSLEAQLQQAQMELSEKALEVSSLKSQFVQVQTSEKGKDAKIQQLERLLQQHNQILNEKSSQLLDLEKSVQIQRDLESDLQQRTQNVLALKEIECQLRDDVQRLKMEVTQREHAQQSLLRELEQCHQLLAEKEADCSRLARDLGSSQVREAQAEAKAVKEVRRISQQMEQQRKKHEQEVEKLENRQTEETAVREQELTCLRLELRRNQDEASLRVNDLQRSEQRLADQDKDSRQTLRELQLQQEKSKELMETIIIKEAEIARLEAKISGYERATFGRGSHRTPLSQTPRPSSKRERHASVPRPASAASCIPGENQHRARPSKGPQGVGSSKLLVPDLSSSSVHTSRSNWSRGNDTSLRDSRRNGHEGEPLSDGELSDALLDFTPPSDLGLTLNQSSL